MAEATYTPKVVRAEEVVLRLTHDEAVALRTVTRYVGGDPRGHRGLTDSIGAALARIPGIEDEARALGSAVEHCLTFNTTDIL